MKKQIAKLNEVDFPPKVPANEDNLERCIALLGNRKQVGLKTPARLELKELIGVYPSAAQADLWKRSLRQIRKERLEDEKAPESSPK